MANIPVLRLLFWNVGRLPRAEMVAALCREHDVGILVLAEWDESPNSVLQQLATSSIPMVAAVDASTRPRCFSRLEFELREFYADISGKLALSEFMWNRERFQLATTHLSSLLNMDQRALDSLAKEIADAVRRNEVERKNDRTILIGDLNLNPFDPGVVETTGFHAVMSKRQAMEMSRTVQGRLYPFFYNPMWGGLGDRTPGPPGTFYYRVSAPLSYDWNTFDQVLLRPAVLQLVDEEVAVLDRVNGLSLLNSEGRPDNQVGSDHLPLLVTLRWKGGKH